MSEDLQSRLKRLGVVKGTRDLKPAPKRQRDLLRVARAEAGELAFEEADETAAIDLLLPGGQLVETDHGAVFTLDKVYPLSHKHGDSSLDELKKSSLAPVATFGRDERLANIDFHDLLFLDTETTGLGGAGTLAFMVGVAYFDGVAEERDAFVVRQYFLRDHGDEPAMLQLLAELLAEKAALVTFNGRSFDLPLLYNRYLMNQLDGLVGELPDKPHIDLLHPARRIWRRRVGSCALGSLEHNLLGLQRTHEDVPGWAIPGLYLDYLRTGDARELLRVFYHNRVDMLSMVTLTSRIVRQFSSPQPEDHPLDLYSLARWQQALDMTAEAEKNLRLAARREMPLELYHETLYRLGALLKRHGRREEAVELWQQIAVTSFDDVGAHVELAKHYEWQRQELKIACHWTKQALALLDSWERRNAGVLRVELEHRLARLERKMARRNEG